LSSRRNILIVDDEPLHTKVFEKFIGDMDHNVIAVNSSKQVLDFFLKKKPIKDNLAIHDIDIMLLDLSMPEIDGLTLLKEIATVKGDLEVIVLTATNNISTAVAAVSLGAVDYIVKGEKDVYARVIISINNAIEKRNLKYQLSTMERHAKDQVSFSDIIGKSDPIMLALALAKKIANSSIPVLIEGSNGVGKEFLARAIHGSSIRSGKPFVAADCESLKFSGEEILFGVDRMLDSGVIEKNLGKIREANGGTLFLDNVNALKLETQIKLLRFIQEGEIEAVGSKAIYKATVRIISSTNKNLRILVDENRFREDLYYRLNIFPIALLSLKERGPEDIRALAENFCHNFCISENKKIKGFSDDAMEILADYEWEDNVRQLKSYIFCAVVLCDDELIKPEHLPRNVRVKDVEKEENKIKRSFGRRTMELVDIFDDENLCKTLDRIEEEVVRRLVEFYNGNLSEVAKQLKVGRSTVYRKLKILNQPQLTDQND